MDDNRLRAAQWHVGPVSPKIARRFLEVFHYARGAANTAVFVHGLYLKGCDYCFGVVWWMPPTRVAAESVNAVEPDRVLALSRMAVFPDAPKNACTFLLARSVALIRADGRFNTLVTYADESQGHTGGVYRAANWRYAGCSRPYYRWLTADGRQVSAKATRNRTVAQMAALGHVPAGRSRKHKFVLSLRA